MPPWSMDQKSTSLYENDLHTTHRPVLAWPSPPSESNTAPTTTLENLLPVQDSESPTTDMQQPPPLVQKVVRTPGVCMPDLLVSSDDEGVSEFLQEGSPSTPFKRGVQAGAFSGQSTGIVNSDEGDLTTPDFWEMHAVLCFSILGQRVCHSLFTLHLIYLCCFGWCFLCSPLCPPSNGLLLWSLSVWSGTTSPLTSSSPSSYGVVSIGG